MPLQTAHRDKESHIALPPPFTLVRLRELGDAVAHAASVAPEMGAGTLVYVGRFDLAEFALVVEPDEPLRAARRAFYAGMVALTDALIATAQPETSITIDWPGAVLVNGGLVGGGRLIWPEGVAEDETPPWLVFGAMIRTVSMSGAEPGLNPLVTVLEEEGFSGVTADHVVESFARHFMVALDGWQEHGFATVAKSYLSRLKDGSGVRREIEESGDLTVRRAGKVDVERKRLTPALTAMPSWYDPSAKGPKA